MPKKGGTKREEVEQRKKNVAILVLGDIGRSPRMQYHAVSLSSLPNTHVDIIGYKESPPHPDLVASPNVTIVPIKPFPALPRAFFLLYAPLKVLLQILSLFWILLFTIARPDYILLQNPPSIPTLFVVGVVGKIRGAKVIVDWHNLGYTLLQLSMNTRKSHPAVRFAKWFERYFGSGAQEHLCVTLKMKEKLVTKWGIPENNITVLYDRAPSRFFKPFSPAERKAFLAHFTKDIKSLSGDKIEILEGSALVISSTSWTKDEDFGVLLDAVEAYNNAATNRKELPPITLVITGKGPERLHYEAKISQMGMKKVRIYTVFLPAEDYPKLLASADLGVCLHISSSKLDLPMKVADMLGVGLPVTAISIDYPALNEALPDQKYGTHFTDSETLNQQLQTLLQNFPQGKKLQQFRENILQDHREGWEDNWTRYAGPRFV